MSTNITISDVLNASYTSQESAPAMTTLNTALLLVDVQNLATPEHLEQAAINKGLPADDVHNALADYSERFYAAVANCERLLQHARAASVPCIHVKIEALSGTARDTGPAHRRLGWCYPPGSHETRFLQGVEPLPGEIVITKTVSGAFTATNLDSALRHMGVEWLLIAGFATDECIEATGRVALDLGYLALFADDACAAYEADAHISTMKKYDAWGLLRSTAALIRMLGEIEQASERIASPSV